MHHTLWEKVKKLTKQFDKGYEKKKQKKHEPSLIYNYIVREMP